MITSTSLLIGNFSLRASALTVQHVIQRSKSCQVGNRFLRFYTSSLTLLHTVKIMATYSFVGLMCILGCFAVGWRCYEESKEIDVKLPCSVDEKLIISKDIDKKTGLPVILLTDNTSLIKVEYI